jgi:hypothetical protein
MAITAIAASMKGVKIGSILILPIDIATIPTSSVALAREQRSSSLVSTMKFFIYSRTLSAYGRKACSAVVATKPIADCKEFKSKIYTQRQ